MEGGEWTEEEKVGKERVSEERGRQGRSTVPKRSPQLSTLSTMPPAMSARRAAAPTTTAFFGRKAAVVEACV